MNTNMTYEYALQRVKGIKKAYDNAQSLKILEYKDSRIFDYYTTPEDFEIFTSTEGMTGSKELAANEAPPILELEDGYSVTLTESRWGAGIELNEAEYKRLRNDDTMKVNQALMRKRDKLLTTNTNFFLTKNFLFLNEAFDSTSDYLAPDSVELCGTHSWASDGADTFSNAGTAALDTKGTAVDAVVEYGGNFKDAAGIPMPIDFDTIIVKKGSAVSRVAKKLFAYGITPISVADINIYEGEYTIIETPYITNTNKAFWFMRSSKNPDGNSIKIGIGQMPTLNEPIKQNNEAIRTNSTGFWKQGVANMPFDWYGSNGTT